MPLLTAEAPNKVPRFDGMSKNLDEIIEGIPQVPDRSEVKSRPEDERREPARAAEREHQAERPDPGAAERQARQKRVDEDEEQRRDKKRRPSRSRTDR